MSAISAHVQHVRGNREIVWVVLDEEYSTIAANLLGNSSFSKESTWSMDEVNTKKRYIVWSTLKKPLFYCNNVHLECQEIQYLIQDTYITRLFVQMMK